MTIVLLNVALAVLALGVLVWLFFSLKRESEKAENAKAVPITTPEELHGKSVVSESSAIDESVKMPPIIVDDTPVSQPLVSLSPTADEDQVRQLKEEIKLIREKAVIQARNAIEVITKLREANEALTAEKNRSQQSAAPAVSADELMHLKAENAAFKAKADELSAEIDRLRQEYDQYRREVTAQMEEQHVQWRQQLESELAQAKDEIDRLRSAGQADGSAPAASVEELASLNKALEVLTEEKEDLESRIRELESVNAIQSEKNNFLQYELTKSRAQAAGLQKVYENSVKQVEDMTHAMDAAAMDNKELKKQTDVLENSLNEFRRLNSELIRREKLSQFEIEKSRGDIEDLERIYAGLRSRINRIGTVDQVEEGKL